MKHLAILLLLANLSLPASGQEETVLGSDIQSGGYGGVFMHVGPIYNKTGIFVGGQGAWIINHKFAIGGGGYGLANDIRVGAEPEKELSLNFGCGGLLLEYIVASDKLFHLNIQTMIGSGGVSFSNRHFNKDSIEEDFGGDAFFFLEPGIHGVLNLSKRVRIGMGATYRYVTGVDYGNLDHSDLSGISGRFIVMFGAF